MKSSDRPPPVRGSIGWAPSEHVPRRSPYRFVIAGLSLLAHLGVGINFFSVSPLLPIIVEDYGISRGAAGLLIALALLTAAAFGLPGGALVSRVGLKRLYLAGWILVGMLTFSAVAANFPMLLALRLGYGIGFALILTGTGPLLMQWFFPREGLTMNGLNTAAISLGIALSVSTAAAIADMLGWRNTLGLFGSIAMAGAVSWAFLGRTTDQQTRVDSPHLSFKEMAGLIRSRPIVLLVAADAGILIQYTALTSWLPTYYHEVRGFGLSQAGFITGLLPLVGVGAVLLGGFLPERIDSRRMFFIVPGVMAALGGPVSFLAGNLPALYLAMVLLGVGTWLYVPLLLTVPMSLAGMTPTKVAVVWGTFITVGGVGMFVSPLIVGVLRDLSGQFLLGFLICSVAAWTLLAAGLLMPKDVF